MVSLRPPITDRHAKSKERREGGGRRRAFHLPSRPPPFPISTRGDDRTCRTSVRISVGNEVRKWSVLPFVAAAFISSSFCRNKALLKEPRRQPAEPARSLFNAFFLVLRAKCPDVSCGILSPERRIYSIFEVPRFICGELGIGGPRGYETVGWTLGHRTGFSPTLFTPSRRRNGFLLPSWFVPYPARSAPIITFHIPTTQLCLAES